MTNSIVVKPLEQVLLFLTNPYHSGPLNNPSTRSCVWIMIWKKIHIPLFFFNLQI